MPNVLIGSKMGSEWRTVLGHPQLIECVGICVLSLAHGSELRGSDIICISWKKSSGNFSLISARVRAFGWPLLGFFFLGIFLILLRGSVEQIIYRENIVFRGSNISCSLASTERMGTAALSPFVRSDPRPLQHSFSLFQSMFYGFCSLLGSGLCSRVSVSGRCKHRRD